MHDDHPLNKPAGQLVTAPRIRRLRDLTAEDLLHTRDSSAHTEIKAPTGLGGYGFPRQLRAYGD